MVHSDMHPKTCPLSIRSLTYSSEIWLWRAADRFHHIRVLSTTHGRIILLCDHEYDPKKGDATWYEEKSSSLLTLDRWSDQHIWHNSEPNDNTRRFANTCNRCCKVEFDQQEPRSDYEAAYLSSIPDCLWTVHRGVEERESWQRGYAFYAPRRKSCAVKQSTHSHVWSTPQRSLRSVEAWKMGILMAC